MKYETKQKIRAGINKTLELLIAAGNLLDEGLYFISYDKLKRETAYLDGDPRRLSNRIHGLERSGYIKISRKNNSIELTTKGRIKLIENSKDSSTDGKWRFLSWDIPENLRSKRQQFCSSIRRIGYRRIQKSLWACPFIRADEVYLIIDELGIRKYVAYIIAEKTDIETDLNRIFSKR